MNIPALLLLPDKVSNACIKPNMIITVDGVVKPTVVDAKVPMTDSARQNVNKLITELIKNFINSSQKTLTSGYKSNAGKALWLIKCIL